MASYSVFHRVTLRSYKVMQVHNFLVDLLVYHQSETKPYQKYSHLYLIWHANNFLQLAFSNPSKFSSPTSIYSKHADTAVESLTVNKIIFTGLETLEAFIDCLMSNIYMQTFLLTFSKLPFSVLLKVTMTTPEFWEGSSITKTGCAGTWTEGWGTSAWLHLPLPG